MKSHLFAWSPNPVPSPTRRRISPGRAGWLAAVVSIALAFPVTAERPEAAESSPVVAVVRAAAPKVLTDKLMTVARQIQPGPQTEALPFVLGGLLGDPFWQSISATENVGVVLYSHDGEVLPVLVLNITEESPLRQSLANFEMTLSDFDGWTLARPAGLPEALLEGTEAGVVAAVRAGRRYDVELTADGPELARRLREGLEEIPEAGVGGVVLVRPLLEALVFEVDAVGDLRVGVNFSAAEIEQVYYLKAVAGSALASFLHQERPQDLGFARYIRADEAVAFLGGFDVRATRDYLTHFGSRLDDQEDEKARLIWQSLHQAGTQYLDSSNGASGGVMSLDGMELQMSSVAPTTLDEKGLLEVLAQGVEAMNELLRLEASQPAGPPSQTLVPHAFTVNGVPVHTVRTETAGGAKDDPGAEPSFALQARQQELHYALVDGHLLSASDLGRIIALIDAIQKGEAVENNLAERMPVADDVLFEFQIDLVRYFGGLMSPLLPDELRESLRRLEARGLKPVRGKLAARGGEAEVTVSLPVETLAAAFQAMAGFIAEQQEQFRPKPGPAQP